MSDTIDRALEPIPQDRYPDIRSFIEALRGAKQSASQTSRTNQTNQAGSANLKDWINQHRMIVGIGGILWGAVLIAAYMSHQNSQKQIQLNWEKWQFEMTATFDQTESLKGEPDVRVKAWKKFLASYAKDNPYSTEDEKLREQGETHKQEAETEMKEAELEAKTRAKAAQQQMRQAQTQMRQAQIAQQQMRQTQTAQQQILQAQAAQQQQLLQAQRDKAVTDAGFALFNRLLH